MLGGRFHGEGPYCDFYSVWKHKDLADQTRLTLRIEKVIRGTNLMIVTIPSLLSSHLHQGPKADKQEISNSLHSTHRPYPLRPLRSLQISLLLPLLPTFAPCLPPRLRHCLRCRQLSLLHHHHFPAPFLPRLRQPIAIFRARHHNLRLGCEISRPLPHPIVDLHPHLHENWRALVRKEVCRN